MKRLTLCTGLALALSCFAAQAGPQVALTTSMGRIVLELDDVKAPVTTANFLDYVRSGHYDGLVFHRVINNFMIQGGGMTPDMREAPTRAPIRNEADNGLKNNRYSVAMARTPEPHSASAQFFINLQNNDFLNHTAPTAQGWGYAVFGQVVQGREVVDKIKQLPTTQRGLHRDVPVQPVIIQKAEVLQ